MNANKNSHDDDLEKADRIAYLIAAHIHGTLTDPEKDELDDWIVESDENLELFEKLIDEDNIEIAMQRHFRMEREKEAALQETKSKINFKQTAVPSKKIWVYLVAASVIIIAGTLLIFKWTRSNGEVIPPGEAGQQKTDIPGGANKAILTLSNGRTILLDSTISRQLANEGNITINKGNEGELIYQGTDREMKYNTVSTPRGGQYMLVLGDGTKVWLNAESHLKFPAGFTTNQRNVELTGEAYFEVAKNPSKPFNVKIIGPSGDSSSVEVLGTHFNINAYGDESIIKTTLLEGSVKVEKDDNTQILHPGEEALISRHITIAKADVNASIAWKQGRFLFRDATIFSIGEQIKRWYDVEVQYEGAIPQHFNLEVNRNVPLSTVLDGLEGTGQVKFKLKGRTLVIMR